MKTQAEIEQLATRYAYDIVTCPGSPDTDEGMEEVFEKWADDETHEDVVVWEPFEEKYSPQELLGTVRDLEAAFLHFAKAITNG